MATAVQLTSDSTIRATLQGEVATAISSISSTEPFHTAISSDASPTPPTSDVTAVASITALVHYPESARTSTTRFLQLRLARSHLSSLPETSTREQRVDCQNERYCDFSSYSNRLQHYNCFPCSPYRRSEWFNCLTSISGNTVFTFDSQGRLSRRRSLYSYP